MNLKASPTVKWSDAESSAWTPSERLTCSEWAEKYRELGAQAEEKGPLRLSRTPYLIPILNLANRIDPAPECNPHGVSFAHVREVVVCKPAQWAGTEAMISIIGYGTHQHGKSVMVSLADSDTAGHIIQARIQPMYRNSRKLKWMIIPGRFSEDEMHFQNGGAIYAAWASSVAKLASKPVDIVVADEIDKPGYSISSKESSALSLLAERTKARSNSMYWKLSTPTIEGGNMHVEIETADIIYDQHVPCPYCGQIQPLRWSERYAPEFEDGYYMDREGKMKPLGGVSWDGGREATRGQINRARYKCGSCGEGWTTQQKNEAVSTGVMVPRQEITDPPRKIAFHSNRLYSLLGTAGDISEMVGDWCEIHKIHDPFERRKRKQGFINSTLAGFWKETLVKPEQSKILMARCALKMGTTPQEAVAITAGIDMQKRGFWYTVRAWARDYTSWLIQYGQVETWADIEALLFGSEFDRLRISRACLDTGGGKSDYQDFSMTEQAYFWLRKNAIGRGCRVWGCKGASSPMQGKIKVGKPFDRTPSGKVIPGGLQIITLDTEALKDMYHYRIGQAIEGGQQAAYLHADTGEDYARQILAEEKQIDTKGVPEWVQVGRDNHLLDCETLCMVCAEPEWPGGGIHLIKKEGSGADTRGNVSQSKTQKKSGFIDSAGFIPKKGGGWFS